jgi:hypothetical protein
MWCLRKQLTLCLFKLVLSLSDCFCRKGCYFEMKRKKYNEVATLWESHGCHTVPLIALNTSTWKIYSQHVQQMAVIVRRENPPADDNIIVCCAGVTVPLPWSECVCRIASSCVIVWLWEKYLLMLVLWLGTPRERVGGYQDGGNMFLWNFAIYLQGYTSLQPR